MVDEPCHGAHGPRINYRLAIKLKEVDGSVRVRQIPIGAIPELRTGNNFAYVLLNKSALGYVLQDPQAPATAVGGLATLQERVLSLLQALVLTVLVTTRAFIHHLPIQTVVSAGSKRWDQGGWHALRSHFFRRLAHTHLVLCCSRLLYHIAIGGQVFEGFG